MTKFQKLLAFFGLVSASELETEKKHHQNDVKKLSGEVEKLEAALEEAKKPKDAPKESSMKTKYKVGYVEAKRRLKKRSLTQLRNALEKVPNNTGGFGGTAIVFRDKQIEAVSFKSKAEALQLVKDAEDGKLHLVF